jgi:hypothetical protein
VAATVNGSPIFADRIDGLLWKGRGEFVLQLLVELQAIDNYAKGRGVTISEADLEAEMEAALEIIEASPAVQEMIAGLEEDERRVWMRRYLRSEYRRAKGVSMDEFMLTLRRNALLRAVIADGVQCTPKEVRSEYERLHGPRARVRRIFVPDRRWADEAMERLAEGDLFEVVAQEMNRDPSSRSTAGLLPPVSMKDDQFAELFRRTAFSLKVGQTSKIVQTPEGFHIIRLIERIPPSGIPFDELRGNIEKRLRKRKEFERMTDLRNRIMANTVVNILDSRVAQGS